MENIILHKKTNASFVIIPTDVLRRSDMSLAAKGLLSYMLSCADSWKFSIKGMATVLGTTPNIIGKYLTELESLGYHKKEAIRGDNGRIKEWKYWVADYPAFIGEPSDKPEKKPTMYEACMNEIDSAFSDEDLRSTLKEFLKFRIKEGRFNATRFKNMLADLKTMSDSTDELIAIVTQSITYKYLNFYALKKSYRRNKFVDDIPVATDDADGILKQKYIDEFSDVPKCDRPSFEDWRKNHEVHFQ